MAGVFKRWLLTKPKLQTYLSSDTATSPNDAKQYEVQAKISKITMKT